MENNIGNAQEDLANAETYSFHHTNRIYAKLNANILVKSDVKSVDRSTLPAGQMYWGPPEREPLRLDAWVGSEPVRIGVLRAVSMWFEGITKLLLDDLAERRFARAMKNILYKEFVNSHGAFFIQPTGELRGIKPYTSFVSSRYYETVNRIRLGRGIPVWESVSFVEMLHASVLQQDAENESAKSKKGI